MKFEDCYPAEIVEWSKTLPAPELCTAQEVQITRLLEDESVIALGRGFIKHLNNAGTRDESNQMIALFRAMIQDAVQYA